jgi:hypothetical protein
MDLARIDVLSPMDGCFGRVAEALIPARRRRAPLPYGLGWFLADYRAGASRGTPGSGRDSTGALPEGAQRTARRASHSHPPGQQRRPQWKTRLDEAAIERSPFAVAFLAAMSGPSLDSPR